jgi:hypothetical protein
MMSKSYYPERFGLVLCALLSVALLPAQVGAQTFRNTISFENQSGEEALVKVIGPVRGNVPVPNGTTRAINVPAGSYYILTRYCDSQGRYSYSKGTQFTVIQTETQYSEITITLHTVPNGNYRTYPATATEFDGN